MMKNTYKKAIFAITIIGALLIPTYVALAAQGTAEGIESPLNVSSISDILTNITKWLLGLVAMLALLALIVGGVTIMTAFGNDSKIQKGKQIVLWAIIGLAVILGAYVIINVVTNLLGAA